MPESEIAVPGATLGVVGGGQLGRMLAEAASPLGVDVVVLDPTPDCPAVPPAADQIVGGFDDPEALDELAARSDALTYEIELADPEHTRAVADEHGVPVHPDPETLRTIQDKLVQKRTFAEAGIPVPEFRRVDDAADLEAAFDDLGRPAMLKARTGGYDGRGNEPVSSVEEAREAFDPLADAMVEDLVDFERELSVIGVKGDGETDAFPVVENRHEPEILRETLAPARTSDAVRERAREVALDVLDELSGRGVYGIELFETSDGEILVNEVAPRPHNSGHYSIEGAVTSQFEQHVRAVLGLPLGDTSLRGPTAMVNVLAEVDSTRPADLSGVDDALDVPGVAFHWYGKEDARPLRKMGHLTAVGTDGGATLDSVLSRARKAREAIDFQ
ncbi:5-(carboxyamino)imidazole ribonucleotide synthase [Halospeciosus flavus]|uniref:N5-carboxyaminoimidazole ribonucleotide synthase n=1 Tax=Halospeciosus flavus TaxID=3032283 RepID=A0ABD5Z421_9EURY|nr:5-(carboxyamino)imidazole ribonucleotide synthase [Halospeciosus flavus]